LRTFLVEGKKHEILKKDIETTLKFFPLVNEKE
jgi:hypothetical protein